MNQEKSLSINFPIDLSNLQKSIILKTVVVLSFFVPFLLGHPQWAVGTIVNACLFLSALYLPKKYYLPIIILPSLGVLFRGIIFGPFTYLLVYFLPFIWIGNLILMVTFKKLLQGDALIKIKNKVFNFTEAKYILSAFCAATAKFLFLLFIANIYFSLKVVPKVFISTMGLNQFATALAGGLISFLLFYYLNKRKNA